MESVREAAPPVMITLSPTDVPSTQVLPKMEIFYISECHVAMPVVLGENEPVAPPATVPSIAKSPAAA